MNSSRKQIVRWEKGSKPAKAMDELAAEEPLEIRVDTHPVSITMRTPGHDDELAIGFLVGESFITRRAQVLKVAPHPRHREKNSIGVFLAPDMALDRSKLARNFFVSSSCGLCGKASIDQVRLNFPALKGKFVVSAEMILQLPDKMRAQQPDFDRTGGLHAAGLFDLTGKLLVAREDVGRHNAVDKVLGHAFLQDWQPLSRHILLVSGRVSFEIVQKALASGIALIAAVSAPSNLAVEFARTNRQTLVGFVRGPRLNVYTHVSRVRFK